jgi:tRNA (cytidine/uridine-2'-O-)-methyltransferase
MGRRADGDLADARAVETVGAVAHHNPTRRSLRIMLHIVLHQPEIPYNTGSVGRTCVAFGAKLWLVRPLGFQVDDRHLRRAGLDYWQHLDWEVVDDWAALEQRMPGCRPWFFTKRATQSFTEVTFRPGDVLVFGSESRGLPPSLVDGNPDRCLRIPIAAEARSLNLSVSVAVATFEATRQIGVSGRVQ